MWKRMRNIKIICMFNEGYDTKIDGEEERGVGVEEAIRE